jgi:chemotaxis protein MotB
MIMARKKQAASAENTEGWLTTYADLISLLLCFFVLMYAASTPDEAKMQFILQSFTRISGDIINPVPVADPMENSEGGEEGNRTPDLLPSNPDGEIPGVPGAMPLTFDDLFNWVSEAVNSLDASAGVSVAEAEGRLHIRFESDVMFRPDSYELTSSGITALNAIIPGINAVQDYIASVKVEGHIAGQPGGTRSTIDDWFLSSMRAVAVTNYLDIMRNMVHSDKFTSTGKGPWDPFASNDAESTRAQNRRVELVITRNNHQPNDTGVIKSVLMHDYKLGHIVGGEDVTRFPPAGDVDRNTKIRERMEQLYGVNADTGRPVDEGRDFDFPIPGFTR